MTTATGSLADLPTDADAFAIVQGNSVAEAPLNSTADLNTNDNCVVAWCIDGTWNWYVGYVKEMLNDEQYIADHLERLRPGNSAVWKYPTIDDTKTVFRDQIVPIQILGDWKITQNARHMTFEVKNCPEIQSKFDVFVKQFS